jgi:hypothetical protein
MTQEILKVQKKEEELVQFFKSLGASAYISWKNGERVVEVLDKRSDEVAVSYTIKLEEQGRKIVIISVGFTTPCLMFSLTDTIRFIHSSDDGKRDISDVTLYNALPISFYVNDFILRMLVESPAFFLFYSGVIGRTELSREYVNHIANKLARLNVRLSEGEVKQIEEMATKLTQ